MRLLLDPDVRCAGCGTRVLPLEERLLRSFLLVLFVTVFLLDQLSARVRARLI